MPSSSALVATTARISPARQAALDGAALAGQVAAAISADGLGGHRAAVAGVFEVGHQYFGREAVVGEYQGLQIPLDKLQGDSAGFLDVAAAD
ncbi:MAG TPA: hypothetical protein VGZ73_17490, partial [Bryobacteraceae bacterium]|nr:hypothetical protein [Bryobacteraceae bacterium]